MKRPRLRNTRNMRIPTKAILYFYPAFTSAAMTRFTLCPC